MEVFHYMLGFATGADIVGAAVAGKGTRLAIAAAAGVASLALPEAVDPAMVLVEFLLTRRVA